MKLKLILHYILYLVINSLFVLKYTSRLNNYNEYVFTLIYFILMFLIIFLYLKISIREYYYKYVFWVISFMFFAFTIYLNVAVDGQTLNVDRWSAMEAGINALLQGEYPYSAIDHLGGRTSDLPTLFFIGIPFYLMGSVGYLQSFSFLAFFLIMLISFKEYKDRLFGLLLLVLSPSYIWEIYVKSDLISNFILVLVFLIIIQNRINKNKKLNIIITSFGAIAFILTRLTAIIPIALLLFKQFYNLSLKEKTRFLVIALLTSIVFFYICFQSVGNLEHFMRYNPFELQNRHLPVLISFITIIMSIMYSFKVNDLTSLMKLSTLLLLLPILISFLINVNENGIFSSIFNSSFDISYFNIIMPFLLMVIILDYKILLPTINKRIIEASA